MIFSFLCNYETLAGIYVNYSGRAMVYDAEISYILIIATTAMQLSYTFRL